MDRRILAAALRVLTSSYNGKQAAKEDVDLRLMSALSDELTYEPDDLARGIVQRILHQRKSA